ncbi:hypothetical protein GCM10023322_57270 [Rugosimonospora acidiphila]|uniref:Carrier domain-containing protein n=1 Tax=Rugosimonospora acidiphila TaxID=556531 RepID=A0ABP9SC01_9ACTN
MTLNTSDRRQAASGEITAILVSNCGLDPDAAAAAPDATLTELGLDSLALLELEAVVADRYGVRVPENAGQLTIDEVAGVLDGAATSPTDPPLATPPSSTGPAAPAQRTASEPTESTASARPSESTGSAQPTEEATNPDPPGHTENSVVIDAPLELVWRMTNDVERWTDLFTEYADVQVLERNGDTVLFRLTMVPDENGISWTWVSERTCDPVRHEVRAHRVETGPFEYMRIFWRYDELPEGVRMTWVQDFSMRPTAPVNNRQMTERLNTNSRPQLDVIRERVERAAAQRPATVPGGSDE